MITDRTRVIIGRIDAVLATRTPIGAGWKLDPATGLYVSRSRGKNMIDLSGLSMMAKSIQHGHADSGKTIRYMGVGTGFTAPAKGDTALVAEVERKEIGSWNNANIASDPVVMIASLMFLTTEAIGNLMECALFQESTGAPMYSRGLFGYGLVTNATQAEPVVIESAGHGLVDGNKVYFEGVEGMTELNGNAYFVDQLSSSTFGLYSDAALTTPVDGTGFGAYVDASPNTATWKTIIPKTIAETLTVNYSLTFPAD